MYFSVKDIMFNWKKNKKKDEIDNIISDPQNILQFNIDVITGQVYTAMTWQFNMHDSEIEKYSSVVMSVCHGYPRMIPSILEAIEIWGTGTGDTYTRDFLKNSINQYMQVQSVITKGLENQKVAGVIKPSEVFNSLVSVASHKGGTL